MYTEKEQAFWDWLELQSDSVQENHRRNIEHLAARHGGCLTADKEADVWRLRRRAGYAGEGGSKMHYEDCWVIAYNTGAGDYSEPYFVRAEDQYPSIFGGHGHTSYATFGSREQAAAWADPLREEAEAYMQERAEYERSRG